MENLAQQKATEIYKFMNGFGRFHYYRETDGSLNFRFNSDKLYCYDENIHLSYGVGCKITPTNDTYSMKIFQNSLWKPYTEQIIEEVSNIEGKDLWSVFCEFVDVNKL